MSVPHLPVVRIPTPPEPWVSDAHAAAARLPAFVPSAPPAAPRGPVIPVAAPPGLWRGLRIALVPALLLQAGLFALARCAWQAGGG